jgi:hypothetical protein
MSSLADSAQQLVQDIHMTLISAPLIGAVLGDPPRIYDDVPEDPTYPYLTYGTVRSEDRNADGGGERIAHQISFHIWSRGAGRREILELLDRVQSVLEAGLSHAIVPLYADVFAAGRGGQVTPNTRHGLLRLSIITES